MSSGREGPKITVLMSVFNGEKYLKEAIDSILTQTINIFEFLIINDGSTDNSRNIILSYNDPKIRLIENQKNLGLTKSLNKGINLAKGEYIARMDSDDISLPERLEKQVSFLDNRKDIACVGCNCFIIDNNGNRTGKIDWGKERLFTLYNILICNNPVGHPMVMYRKEIVKLIGSYSENYKTCQDMELWVRLYFNGFECENIPEYLFKYRTHKDQISKNNNEKKIFIQIYKYYFDRISPKKYSENQIEKYQNCYVWYSQHLLSSNISLFFNLFGDLLNHFKTSNFPISEVKELFIKNSKYRILEWNLKLYISFYLNALKLHFKK